MRHQNPKIVKDNRHVKIDNNQNEIHRQQRIRNCKSFTDISSGLHKGTPEALNKQIESHRRVLSRNKNQSTSRLVPRVAYMHNKSFKGPIRQNKMIETLNDHYRDYTFKPRICSTSKEIVKRKRLQAMQEFSDMKSSMEGALTQNTTTHPNFHHSRNNTSHTFDASRKHMRAKTRRNTHVESIIESHRMTSWLNRSLDQNTHSRLYNDAKYHNARNMHRKRLSTDKEIED